jgi:hypothetical protein
VDGCFAADWSGGTREVMEAWDLCAGCVKSTELPLLARGRTERGAKPVRLCPRSSDVNLFSYGEGIIDFNAEIPDGALDLCVS